MCFLMLVYQTDPGVLPFHCSGQTEYIYRFKSGASGASADEMVIFMSYTRIFLLFHCIALLLL